MNNTLTCLLTVAALVAFNSCAIANSTTATAHKPTSDSSHRGSAHRVAPLTVNLGPRPYYLVEDMDAGPLKEQLQQCAQRKRQFRASEFSIAHRGAPLQFPEHTLESYTAAARMGAGVIECDVTFTQDRVFL